MPSVFAVIVILVIAVIVVISILVFVLIRKNRKKVIRKYPKRVSVLSILFD